MNKDGTFNVMVLGSGAREHAIAKKMSESDIVRDVIVTPGNEGIAYSGIETLTTANYRDYGQGPVDINNFEQVESIATQNKIDLVVVGPEVPLVNGIVNYWNENGIANKTGDPFIFGPTKEAAMLEGSKVFAKQLMRECEIPTADFQIFEKSYDAKHFVQTLDVSDLVVKADGLAAGKGAIVCHSVDEQIAAIEQIMDKKEFGDAGSKIVIEDFLKGEEASVFAISNGSEFKVLVSSQDHKPVGDGDTGLNTGGMGAYAPAPIVTPEVMTKVKQRIIIPTLNNMLGTGKRFVGCLYVGLMIDNGEPSVVEYNVRLGDPEAQVVLPMLNNDLFDMMYSAVNPSHEVDFSHIQIMNHPGAACNVVLASEGYPGKYDKGVPINGLDDVRKVEGTTVYHAGTKVEDGQVLSNGGRVLGVTGLHNELNSAIGLAYAGIHKIDTTNFHYRNDIGRKGLTHLKK